jgi:hypothetical protein
MPELKENNTGVKVSCFGINKWGKTHE